MTKVQVQYTLKLTSSSFNSTFGSISAKISFSNCKRLLPLIESKFIKFKFLLNGSRFRRSTINFTCSFIFSFEFTEIFVENWNYQKIEYLEQLNIKSNVSRSSRIFPKQCHCNHGNLQVKYLLHFSNPSSQELRTMTESNHLFDERFKKVCIAIWVIHAISLVSWKNHFGGFRFALLLDSIKRNILYRVSVGFMSSDLPTLPLESRSPIDCASSPKNIA